MMKKKYRGIDIFSLSFLDVVSCGFGAIILLLVLSRLGEPLVRERISEDLRAEVRQLELKRDRARRQAREMAGELAREAAALPDLQKIVRQRREQVARQRVRLAEIQLDLNAQQRIKGQLQAALQKLTSEMRQLAADTPPPPPDSPIGGVVVDSEYVIFVIDTSGSMQRFAWPLVRKKMAEVLAVHPQVKGIQVMNDMGDYMFSQYAGRWISDSRARRRAILKRLASWAPFSNSSPVEGITRAIRAFHRPGRKISIYVLGDDFSRGSIQAVLDTVDRLNRAGPGGKRLVRIHGIGFPVLLEHGGAGDNAARFAALMRRLAWDNNGSFVGLSSLRAKR